MVRRRKSSAEAAPTLEDRNGRSSKELKNWTDRDGHGT